MSRQLALSDLRVEALVYVVAGGSITTLWIANGRRHRLDVGSAPDVAAQIDALREELADPRAVARRDLPRLREFAGGWGRSLIPPGVLADPPDVLLLIPHAMLHDLPLLFVLTDEGEPLGCATGICHASSPSQYVRCTTRNVARRDFGRARQMMLNAVDVRDGDDEDLFRLAHGIAQSFAGSARLDEFPARRYVVKSRAGADVVCLIAHGYLDIEDHRLSGLLVNADEGNYSTRSFRVPGDRLVSIRDLPLRDFPAVESARIGDVATLAEMEIDGATSAELVVLLACSTGSGRVLEGDEPASIAEAFLHVGAASVVAPLWDVDRDVASRWAERFFTAWQRDKLPKALAGREALRELRDGGRPVDHLGSFVLKGDWI